jgi:hypothetical protein
MTIEEGTGDEFLLVCFVCKNPFGLVAQFCGYCQVTRQQALGVERARPNQQIIAVQEPKPTELQPPPPKPTQGIFTPPPKPIKTSQPKKVRKRSDFIENTQLRSKSFNSWQKKNSKSFVSLGMIAFLFSLYFSIQSVIFLTNSPLSVAEKRLYLGATRNTLYFDNSTDNAGIRFFPPKFSSWSDSTAGKWTSSGSWNGWKGTATVNFLGAGRDVSGIPITGKFKAEYSTTLGIFRNIKWIPEAPAVIEINYPSNPNLSIYINGLAAGTTLQPSVRTGTYQIYPGALTVNFFNSSTGDELTEYSRSYFIDAQGSYDLGFN